MPKVTKKKGGEAGKKKVIHPNSRAAAVISRLTSREGKQDKKQKERSQKIELLGEKLNWFHSHLEDGKESYSKLEVHQLIHEYLHRFDEEKEQIEIVNTIKGRSGNQHASRTNAIQWTIERETQLYQGQGIEVPDLVNSKNLEVFREWTGELRFIQNLKQKTYSASDLERCKGKEAKTQKDCVNWEEVLEEKDLAHKDLSDTDIGATAECAAENRDTGTR